MPSEVQKIFYEDNLIIFIDKYNVSYHILIGELLKTKIMRKRKSCKLFFINNLQLYFVEVAGVEPASEITYQ